MKRLVVIITVMAVNIAYVKCESWSSGSGSGKFEPLSPVPSGSSTASELTQLPPTLEDSATVSYPGSSEVTLSIQVTPSLQAKSTASTTSPAELSSTMRVLAVTSELAAVTSDIQMPEPTPTLSITATQISDTAELLASLTTSDPGSSGSMQSSTIVRSTPVLFPQTEMSSVATTHFLSASPEVTVRSSGQRSTPVPSVPSSTPPLPTGESSLSSDYVTLTTTPPDSELLASLTPSSSLPSYKSTIIVTVPPSPSPHQTSSNFFTSTLFLAAASGAAALLLVLILLTLLIVACRKRVRRKCPCCRVSHKIKGPIISVSYRGSNQGDRESYYFKTSDLGPTTTFYTRPGEDDASKEFTTAFFMPSVPPADPVTFRMGPATKANPAPCDVGPVTHVDPVSFHVDPVTRRHEQRDSRSVKFKSLERNWKPSPQHLRKEGEREETDDLDNEFRLSDLDDLEKVLDNALIRFETTTL